MKRNKFYLVGLTLFLMVIGMNLQYALNNYGMLSLRFNPEILATGTGGSGTTEPNYSYMSQLEADECILYQVTLAAGALFKGVPVAAAGTYTDYGSKMVCKFSLISRCNQNLVTPCAPIN